MATDVIPPCAKVIYKLRDVKAGMVDAWTQQFSDYIDCPSAQIQISKGDIFKGAPSADAIVSPANSFGFMDGGIDMVYSLHFGWQMQARLQELIRKEYDGELLVGQAVIIPAYADENGYEPTDCNEGVPIEWLISAPTMRVPNDVHDTVHAYLAFRAVILAVKKHNADPSKKPIQSVLCPGLGTAVGRMPFSRCAFQMKEAFRFNEVQGNSTIITEPSSLTELFNHHEEMKTFKK